MIVIEELKDYLYIVIKLKARSSSLESKIRITSADMLYVRSSWSADPVSKNGYDYSLEQQYIEKLSRIQDQWYLIEAEIMDIQMKTIDMLSLLKDPKLIMFMDERFVKGLSVQQISRECGCTERTVFRELKAASHRLLDIVNEDPELQAYIRDKLQKHKKILASTVKKRRRTGERILILEDPC